MGLWGEVGFYLALSSVFFSGGYFNSRHYNKSKATITKKNKYLLLGATEELSATVIVVLLFVLSTPNAMPLLTQRHRPTHGALLLPCGKNFFF